MSPALPPPRGPAPIVYACAILIGLLWLEVWGC